MATLYVTEYATLALGARGESMQIGQEPAIAEQTVAIGVGSAQSSAFAAQTTFVRLHSDAICSVAFGTNPTATASNKRMAAGQTEFFGVNSRASKVAVITNT